VSPHVCVLGAGSWGTALSHVLARNGASTITWAHSTAVAEEINGDRRNTKYLPGVELAPFAATTEISDAVTDAGVIVCVVPSHHVREVLGRAKPDLRGQPILVSASKGIEVGTDLRMSELFSEVLGDDTAADCVVLSGPSFAEELVRGLPTACAAASCSEVSRHEVQRLFQNDHFRVYTLGDVVGTELGGSLKNVIALAAGISDGIRLGNNARAALITRGLAEISRLATRLGAEEHTLAGLAGIGDLILTCTGDLSRNRTVGLAIGAGRPLDEVLAGMHNVVEGIRTTKAAVELADRYDVEMPIASAVYSILYEGVAPAQALTNLMARDPKPERWS
jgi:glycerol-3-phosphate dehydrogenase (NAD(P)+)